MMDTFQNKKKAFVGFVFFKVYFATNMNEMDSYVWH